MGLDTLRHRTPGIVVTSTSPLRACAAWNAAILSYATSNAACTSASSVGSGRSSTRSVVAANAHPSNFRVYSRTASSPLVSTASTIGRTTSKMDVKSTRGRFITSIRPRASSSRSTYVFIAKPGRATACVAVVARAARARVRARAPVALAPRVVDARRADISVASSVVAVVCRADARRPDVDASARARRVYHAI